ncbi:MAG: hypothetical protein ACXADC_13440 [Candidatus Thorarchaeota archaeon]|jgi:hypothetical protein
MNRIRRTIVVAIIGMAILGFGFITAVEAVKPPPLGGYPDAERIWLWDYNVIEKSDASYVLGGWVYWVEPGYDETELFPQPIRIQMWITEDGSETETEIKLSRHAVGHGQLDEWGFLPEELPYLVGPMYRWYAYFPPGYFDVGEYQTHIRYTCKDPDNPRNRIVVVDPFWGPIDWYGWLSVQDG